MVKVAIETQLQQIAAKDSRITILRGTPLNSLSQQEAIEFAEKCAAEGDVATPGLMEIGGALPPGVLSGLRAKALLAKAATLPHSSRDEQHARRNVLRTVRNLRRQSQSEQNYKPRKKILGLI